MYSQDHIFCPYRSECEVPNSSKQRDYTNPYLPVAPSAIDGSGQITVGSDGKKLEPESNVLLASIKNMQYAVTLDVLHIVFSAFGPVQKIAMFDKNGGVQALIQYPDVQTAIVAKDALEGHCVYDGGFCKLHISYTRHTDLSLKVNNDWSRDYTLSNIPAATSNSQPSILGQLPSAMIGAPAQQYEYAGVQYIPSPSQPMVHQTTAAWGSAVNTNASSQFHAIIWPARAVPQSMPMQVPHSMPPYGQPRAVPLSNGTRDDAMNRWMPLVGKL